MMALATVAVCFLLTIFVVSAAFGWWAENQVESLWYKLMTR
jgi:hypothetical protein